MKTQLSLLILTLLAFVVPLRAVEPLDPVKYTPPITPIKLDHAAWGLQLYVWTNGNDKWNGRSASHAAKEKLGKS